MTLTNFFNGRSVWFLIGLNLLTAIFMGKVQAAIELNKVKTAKESGKGQSSTDNHSTNDDSTVTSRTRSSSVGVGGDSGNKKMIRRDKDSVTSSDNLSLSQTLNQAYGTGNGAKSHAQEGLIQQTGAPQHQETKKTTAKPNTAPDESTASKDSVTNPVTVASINDLIEGKHQKSNHGNINQKDVPSSESSSPVKHDKDHDKAKTNSETQNQKLSQNLTISTYQSLNPHKKTQSPGASVTDANSKIHTTDQSLIPKKHSKETDSESESESETDLESHTTLSVSTTPHPQPTRADIRASKAKDLANRLSQNWQHPVSHHEHDHDSNTPINAITVAESLKSVKPLADFEEKIENTVGTIIEKGVDKAVEIGKEVEHSVENGIKEYSEGLNEVERDVSNSVTKVDRVVEKGVDELKNKLKKKMRENGIVSYMGPQNGVKSQGKGLKGTIKGKGKGKSTSSKGHHESDSSEQQLQNTESVVTESNTIDIKSQVDEKVKDVPHLTQEEIDLLNNIDSLTDYDQIEKAEQALNKQLNLAGARIDQDLALFEDMVSTILSTNNVNGDSDSSDTLKVQQSEDGPIGPTTSEIPQLIKSGAIQVDKTTGMGVLTDPKTKKQYPVNVSNVNLDKMAQNQIDNELQQDSNKSMFSGIMASFLGPTSVEQDSGSDSSKNTDQSKHHKTRSFHQNLFTIMSEISNPSSPYFSLFICMIISVVLLYLFRRRLLNRIAQRWNVADICDMIQSDVNTITTTISQSVSPTVGPNGIADISSSVVKQQYQLQNSKDSSMWNSNDNYRINGIGNYSPFSPVHSNNDNNYGATFDYQNQNQFNLNQQQTHNQFNHLPQHFRLYNDNSLSLNNESDSMFSRNISNMNHQNRIQNPQNSLAQSQQSFSWRPVHEVQQQQQQTNVQVVPPVVQGRVVTNSGTNNVNSTAHEATNFMLNPQAIIQNSNFSQFLDGLWDELLQASDVVAHQERPPEILEVNSNDLIVPIESDGKQQLNPNHHTIVINDESDAENITEVPNKQQLNNQNTQQTKNPPGPPPTRLPIFQAKVSGPNRGPPPPPPRLPRVSTPAHNLLSLNLNGDSFSMSMSRSQSVSPMKTPGGGLLKDVELHTKDIQVGQIQTAINDPQNRNQIITRAFNNPINNNNINNSHSISLSHGNDSMSHSMSLPSRDYRRQIDYNPSGNQGGGRRRQPNLNNNSYSSMRSSNQSSRHSHSYNRDRSHSQQTRNMINNHGNTATTTNRNNSSTNNNPNRSINRNTRNNLNGYTDRALEVYGGVNNQQINNQQNQNFNQISNVDTPAAPSRSASVKAKAEAKAAAAEAQQRAQQRAQQAQAENRLRLDNINHNDNNNSMNNLNHNDMTSSNLASSSNSSSSSSSSSDRNYNIRNSSKGTNLTSLDSNNSKGNLSGGGGDARLNSQRFLRNKSLNQYRNHRIHGFHSVGNNGNIGGAVVQHRVNIAEPEPIIRVLDGPDESESDADDDQNVNHNINAINNEQHLSQNQSQTHSYEVEVDNLNCPETTVELGPPDSPPIHYDKLGIGEQD